MTEAERRIDDVKEYYGETLNSSDDLKTSACCPIDVMPEHIRPYLINVHDEVKNRFYGCGSPIPFALEGKTVLDLGCGTGRDCYILSQLVGENGKVIGVDMTEKQLRVANDYLDYHTEKFGHKSSNITFYHGFIEDLKSISIDDESVDLVISNCVINLSSDKSKVFSEIFRVLKPGGELFFSDVFTGSRVPEELTKDPVLVGECLGGALYTEDFRRLMTKVGFGDTRAISKSKIELNDKEIKTKAGMIDFYSMTMRTFKCDFEDICENYGHVAFYKGGIKDCEHKFVLDDHHIFEKGLPYPVCGNTAKMLSETRYKDYFNVIGDFSVHYGPFDCTKPEKQESTVGCC